MVQFTCCQASQAEYSQQHHLLTGSCRTDLSKAKSLLLPSGLAGSQWIARATNSNRKHIKYLSKTNKTASLTAAGQHQQLEVQRALQAIGRKFTATYLQLLLGRGSIWQPCAASPTYSQIFLGSWRPSEGRRDSINFLLSDYRMKCYSILFQICLTNRYPPFATFFFVFFGECKSLNMFLTYRNQFCMDFRKKSCNCSFGCCSKAHICLFQICKKFSSLELPCQGALPCSGGVKHIYGRKHNPLEKGLK